MLEVYWCGAYPMKDGSLSIRVDVYQDNEGYSAYAAYDNDPKASKEGKHPYSQQKAVQMAVKKLKVERRKHLKSV
ncbi:hypothetical protein ACFOU2_21350 [Bacillus songklensis]|uniref:Uncharacterized protein n=1 Tax=Bacillus songklensis TaxID=1069116 RepID=A0ABV8B6F2_9BACI